MPKIKSFAPGWLNEPSPGHQLFEQSDDDARGPAALAYGKKAKPGPRRTIARRGTEVFVASGKQIRWGDLAYLKETWETRQARPTAGARIKRESPDTSFEYGDGTAENGSIIKTPVADDIRQLVMSPNQDLLAVLTAHTVHICILPDSSHLYAKDATPFKPKFWTLGPTTHVTSRSAVVSALWHPLGVNGSTLVTITEDAVVRLWELSTADRWTFDAPTLAVDLKRLADGTSLGQDFSASTSATNKAFSPDSFDMEVAAACFPARDSGGWSPMTLWVAMTSGDVYALCPLLPKRWAPPPTLIPALSVAIVARVAAIEDDPEASAEARLMAQQQLEWMSDLDNQEPKIMEGSFGDALQEVYTRPSRPGLVPKLQGPFDFDLNPEDEQDDEVELKDIYVIGEKANLADLMMGEEEELEIDENDRGGLSLTVVCLLSTSGQVKICLDVDGVEAQWLPPQPKHKSGLFASPPRTPSLLTFQTFDTLKPIEVTPESWPMFSEDVTSRYSFYVTHPAGISFVSLAPWVFRLESELQGDSEAGAEFRLDLLAKGQGSERERIYTQARGQSVLAAATAFKDPDLGHFVLSATYHDPVVLFFETPELEISPRESPSVIPEQRERSPPPVGWEPRPLFHPSAALDIKSAVPVWIEHLKTGRRRPLLQQEVRLSMATLEVFTEGHKVVSNETSEINSAVAELFRKCEALQIELRHQIEKVNEVKARIDTITGEDSADDEPVSQDMLVQNRLREARQKQEELASRMEKLKRTLGRATSRELSDKERAWAEEVRALESSILGPAAAQESSSAATTPKVKQPWKRFEEIRSLRDALFSQVEQLQRAREAADDDSPASPALGPKIPAEIRRAKMAQIIGLLDRETALVDAVKSRIERLSIE
ncbi:f3f86e95-2746-4f46-8272-8161dd0057d6 [Thermothielavioides terrestris]|uniref:F3f86e95-2746-4f46-8272-8161dd0057d6 n=1 Tax=Thermothielavioides terrestris TaxID=2587410 RepID=A0A3S4C6M7_9PEZI|nr:f3f86e95-2746-4f46-8272-8161dd0057d6 [Thermothielavioides terrestris]